MQSAPGGRLKRAVIPEAFEEIEISADQLQPWPCPDSDCLDCWEHFRHIDDQTRYLCNLYAKNLPASEAQEVAKRLSSAATANRQRLQQRLSQHGDVFVSRWKKRSKDKRADLLNQASPYLQEQRYVTHMEHTQSNGGSYEWKESRTAKYRFRALLPYLALNALKDNASYLFALLHYRTAYTLEEWVAFDLHQFRDSWKVGLLESSFSALCVRVHGEGYGELVPFNAASVHRGDTVGYPRGSLLLEAQASLMEFLLKVVDLTIEGANLDTFCSTKWTTMCHEGFRSTGDIAQWSAYSNQPFSAPPVLDVDALVNTAGMQFNSIADHIALLQTDPAYMRRYIRTIHQGDAAKNTPGVYAFTLVDSHISLEVRSLYWWLCVKEEAEHVKDMRRRFQDQIHRGSPLPRKYDRALACLELVLVNQMIERCDTFRHEFEQRPGFSRYYTFQHSANGTMIMRRTDKGPLANKFKTDPLYWCLMNLCAEPDMPGNFDHASLFTFLEDHLAKSSKEERARLDQVIFDHFSELAANHQLLLAVRLNRPQNKAGDSYEMKETEDRRVWRDRLLRAGRVMPGLTGGTLLKNFYEINAPSGRRDAAWIGQHEKTHIALTAYWSCIRDAAPDHMKDEAVAKYLKVDLEASYLAELENHRQAIRDEMASRRAVPKFESNESWKDDPIASAQDASVLKRKTKTRSSASGSVEDAHKTVETTENGQEAVDASSRISATKRAMDVFSRMFAGDNSETATGCDWDQFVHAMKDVGFVAKNSTGSAVIFELNNQGKIIFHRPHPVAKIDSVMLKAMGKRLSKWFGWNRDSFELTV